MLLRGTALTLFVLVAGCSSAVEPTASGMSTQEVESAIFPALCTRWQACDAVGFAATFGKGGAMDCATRFSEVTQAYGAQAGTPTQCTADELHQCVEDVAKEDCSTLDVQGLTSSAGGPYQVHTPATCNCW